jgi:hypothetical protein
MIGAGDPDCTMVLEEPAARGDPSRVELKIGCNTAALIPCSLVYRGTLPAFAGEPPVGEVVGRIGKDHVNGLFPHPGEEIKAVSMVQGITIAGKKRRYQVIIGHVRCKSPRSVYIITYWISVCS